MDLPTARHPGVANPQPKGGLTCLFGNLTEKIDLESRYRTAVRVQGETLDNLVEGVAVFGPDGRLRLSNPAFANLWGLGSEAVAPEVHVSAIRELCDSRAKDSPWAGFVAAVTGFDEERRDRHGQTELENGGVLRYAVINLPNGQVMLTFVDVTDSVNVERALKEKNEALLKADQLKNEFVQHVSYELRSPLTNIIGFTELLSLPATGPLSPKQQEYVEHIGSSSSVLLTIVNDILDLATVDAGIMSSTFPRWRWPAPWPPAELVADRWRSIDTAGLDTAAAPGASTRRDAVRQILYICSATPQLRAEGASSASSAARWGRRGVLGHDDGPGIAGVLETVSALRAALNGGGGARRVRPVDRQEIRELHGGTAHETARTWAPR